MSCACFRRTTCACPRAVREASLDEREIVSRTFPTTPVGR